MNTTPPGIPGEHVTVNQIVAANLRRWRRAAGMTQDEVGRRVGWSAAVVSAAERSADESRDRRRFDAHELAALALALGVPLAALFLPPPGDGTLARYEFTAPDGFRCDMAGLMEMLVMPDSGEDSPVMDAYRDAFSTAARAYLDPDWAAAAGRWLRSGSSPQELADQAARLRARRDDLLRAAAEFGELADAIDDGTVKEAGA